MAKAKLKETPADNAVRERALENSGARLLEHVEALEGLGGELKALRDRVAERFALLKGEGYDRAAVKALLKRRGMTEKQLEGQAQLGLILETYEQALELAEGER